MWMTPAELSKREDIPIKSIYNHIRHRRLDCDRRGKLIRITAEQWAAFTERSNARCYGRRKVQAAEAAK